jgi:repressor LexA
MPPPLTSKQKQVLDALRELTNQLGKPPTLEELREYLQYGNTSSVQRHIYALIAKGILTNDKNKARSYSISRPTSKVIQIPLVGQCACGTPILAQENIEAYIPYDIDKLKGSHRDYFFLRAVGDSMNRANIDHGDYVLVRKTDHAEPGQRVVALIGDDATIKKLGKKDSYYVLLPESTNPANKPIFVFDSLSIQGVVADVIKVRTHNRNQQR